MAVISDKPLHFAARQKSGAADGVNGELFGISNLFRMSSQRIATLDILGKPEKLQASYRIEEVDPTELGENLIQIMEQ